MRHWLLLPLMLAACGLASAGAADFEVEVSNSAPNPVGRTFARGDHVALLAGKKITLLDRTSGKPVTRECHGPYAGVIEKCPVAPQASTGGGDVPGGTRGE